MGPLLTAYQVSRLDPASSCYLLDGITQGGAKSRIKWEDSLPSVADSPDLALDLKKHKAFSWMSF